jgi:tuberculosinol/isotuberculosinol synthase
METHRPSLEEFLELPTEEVARIVRAAGSKVVVFPFNGTRRWFLLEHGRDTFKNPAQAYVDLTAKAYIEVYKLLFDYGLDTVIAPVFGGEILNRGDDYMEQIGKGMSLLAEHPAFLSFYNEYDVAVRFYGDYRYQLAGTPYAFMSDLFDQLTKQTEQNKRCRLFYGVFGTDATEAIAKYSIEFHKQNGRAPTRPELIEWYYADAVEKADIFIGFEKFNVFDYPLLGWGEESLYFTVAPSLYMTGRQLRTILYDYLYLRPVQDPDYFTMSKDDFEAMHRCYEANRDVTFGVGEMRGGIWYATRIKDGF